MQKLNNFEYKLRNLSLKTRFLLLLFPLIVLAILVFFIRTHFQGDLKSLHPIKAQVNALENKMRQSANILHSIELIEKFAKENEITLGMIKEHNKTLVIEFVTQTNNLIHFIEFLEWFDPYSYILFLDIKNQDNGFKGKFTITFHQYYAKETSYISKQNSKFEQSKFELMAIIGKHVIINNKLIQVKGHIGTFVLSEIRSHEVVLKRGSEIITLRMYNEVK